jgi:cyclopropane-fatty-acyl-phospholipid synthase
MNDVIKNLKERLKITNEEFNVVNDSFYRRLNDGGDLSIIIGESYMAGEWTSSNLLVFFRKIMVVDNYFELFLFTLKNTPFQTTKLLWNIVFADLKLQLRDTFQNNQTVKLAKRVAEQHYDIPYILYEKMMDSHMQYTCAYWKPGTTTLEEAQQNKINLLIDKLQIPENTKMTILDIGCGWGGLTRAISKRYPKCRVEGITISQEQLDYVDEKYGSKKLKYYYCDYRDLLKKKKKYDRITVVGMIEHVGIKNYKELLQICEKVLTDDGIFVLHSITQHKQAKYITGKNKISTIQWIDKYIFPGGYIPTAEQILYSAESTGLMYHHMQNLSISYVKTLQAWYDNFVLNWKTIQESNPTFFTQKFYNMWEFYLLSCVISFEKKKLQLSQYVFTKRKYNDMYIFTEKE